MKIISGFSPALVIAKLSSLLANPLAILLVIPLFLLLPSCATTTLLPAKPSEVEGYKESKWPRQKHIACAILPQEGLDNTLELAAAALEVNDFKIVRRGIFDGVVIGEHGITWVDWNVMAGVYLTPYQQGVEINVVAVGDADPRPIGLASFDWHNKVLNAMTSASSSPVTECVEHSEPKNPE